MPKAQPNVGLIGDQHAPFTHPDYLEFCRQTFKAHGCTEVVHIGDVVDQHAISFHDHDPDGDSPGAEVEKARAQLKVWFKAFPKAKVCIGNHDALIARRAFTAGLPRALVRSLAEVYGAPEGWDFRFEHDMGNWQAIHGTGYSGFNAAFAAAHAARKSTACGHIHTTAQVRYHASNKDLLWGLNTGCGIDRKSYAFAYGKDFKDKPILGCGLVLEGGTLPMFVPMPL